MKSPWIFQAFQHFFVLHLKINHQGVKTCHHTSDLIAKVTSHLHQHWSQINQPPKEVWILKFTVHLVICKCQNYVLYKYQPLQVNLHLSWWRPLFEVETSWIKLLCKFHYWWSEHFNVSIFLYIYRGIVQKVGWVPNNFSG